MSGRKYDQENYYDVVEKASFDKMLSAPEIVEVIQLILDILLSKEASHLDLFLDGLSNLKISETELEIGFRFSRRIEEFRNLDTEDIAHQRVNFISHLFAKIDNKFSLSHVSLPSGFRSFLNLSEYYGIDDIS